MALQVWLPQTARGQGMPLPAAEAQGRASHRSEEPAVPGNLLPHLL